MSSADGAGDDYYKQVRALTDAVTTSNRVEVNQRALIDKILARYATASAVYRELLQNSNDAGARDAEIQFTTNANDSSSSTNSASSTVTQVLYRNNGMPFRPQDWDRLQKIAEGNPDVSKVGAFGVGAYTMFSVAEEPVIISGDKCLVFTWQGDALYTKQAPNQHVSEWTTFLLPSRDPYPLPDWDEFGEFLTAALTFTNALRCITVTVNGTEKLKIVKSIRQPPRRVVQPQAPANATAAATSKASFLWSSIVGGATSSSSNTQSSSGVFYLPRGKDAGGGIYESLVRVTVRVDGTAAAYMDAQYVAATARTKIGPDMARRMQRVTKKEPPKECLVQVFLNHSAPTAKLVEEGQQQQQQQNSTTTTTAATSSQKKRALSIAQSFAPVHGQGRIFIGFRTSQSTGLAAHVAAPFVPTVEREAMDLQDAVLSKFNRELLEFSGILLRLTLEHTMRNVVDVSWQAGRADRDALDAKLRMELKLEQEKKKSKKSAKAAAEAEEVAVDDDGETASSTSILSFARFMAKGVKKKIVKVAKTAATLIEGDGSEQLLYPPDPRPLSEEEQQAVVLMSSFCPQQSTPDPAVGTCLAQGFSNCLPGQTPPVLTKSGVVPGNDARTPLYGIEQFVSENVIRKVVFSNAEEYHTVIAQCRALSFDDLLKAVSATVLAEEQAVTLIKWSTRFAKIDSRSSSQIRMGRLKEAIRFHPRDDPSAVVKLSEFLFFVDKESNDSGLRELPLPDTALPEKLQGAIGYTALKSDALLETWFSPLPIEIWAEFISCHSCMSDAKPEDELLRLKVLSVLSREYMRRSVAERSVTGDFFRSLLSNKRCIPFDSDQPTRFAADQPSDLYLYSAELKAFDGVGSFHKVSGSLQSAGVTDEFLLALGVRKSVSIDFLFAHLDTLSWNQDPKALVEYLRSATLTRSDMHKLSATRYLPAADDSSKTFAPSELYLPNEDLRLFPFVKQLQWPSESMVSERSENGKFLVKLGMKKMPSLSIVLSYLSQPELAHKQLVQGIDFVCDNLVPHGAYYAQYNSMGFSEKKKYRFLPCVVSNPVSGEITLQRYSPVTCFSGGNCAIMGFPVIDPKLGKKGKLYGSLFQCDVEPPSSYLLNQLAHLVSLAKGPAKASTVTVSTIEQSFAAIFKYLSDRSSDLNYASLEGLKNESFIPCKLEEAIVWHRPDEIFFKRADRGTDSLTEDLFHVIEFSPFLAAAGVKEEATTKDLFKRMIAQPDEVLRLLGSEKKYRSLLRRIAADPPFSLSHPSPEIRQAPFLLGYSVKSSADAKSESKSTSTIQDKMTFHLAKAEDVYVIDNSNYGRIFSVFRAPPESDLEDFYVMLGSRYISKAVDRRFEVVGKAATDTELTNALEERLRERGPLLVSPIVTSRPLVSGASAILDEKRLKIYQATNLMAVFTLGKISRRNRTTCFSRNMGGNRNAIYVTSDLDMFDAGMAIGDLILKRCQLEDAFFISSLLEAPLDQLRARGFPVDRIIKQPDPVIVPETKPPPAGVPETKPPAAVPNAARPAAPNSESESTPSTSAATNGHATAKPEFEEPSESSSSSMDSKADILMQMFPDADRNFIEAALGSNPSLDDVRSLAENMAGGSYPKADVHSKDHSDAGTEATATDASTGSAPPALKKKSIRKRLGRAFGGLRGSAGSAGGSSLPPPVQGMPEQSGNTGISGPPRPTQHHETRAPVPPASDAHSHDALDRMLENSVNTTSRVQQRDIDSAETKLTSIPQELDLGEACEIIPGQSLKPFPGPRGNGCTHNGIVVFSSKTHLSSETFLAENEASLQLFADVLEGLCVGVFGLKLSSIAIYHDPGGGTIAFNSGRALHCNFRFFHALHFLQNKHQSSECYSYWFVILCHELAHNFVTAHGREHGFYTESFSTKFLPKLLLLLRSLNIE